MNDFRENYLIAREIVARELIEKYKLVESYKDNERLTLDSTNHSIHLTFYIPDGNDVFISEKGKEPAYGHSFMYYLFEKYPKNEERTKILKELYKNCRASSHFDFSLESIQDNLTIMTNFISHYSPHFFITS
jgi:hypothetical protein